MSLAWRFLYRLYRNYSSLRHWAERRFSRAGLMVAGALLVAGMMGPDTDNNVTYQAFTLLLCLVLVAVSFSAFFGGKFSVQRQLPRFGSVGCPLQYRVTVKNLGRKTQRGLVLLEGLADARASFSDWRAAQLGLAEQIRSFPVSQGRRLHPFRVATVNEAILPPIHANEQVEAKIELTPQRRGVLRFDHVTLARPDPLGLFRAFCNVPLAQTTLILPKRYPLPALALPGTMKYQEGGVALASNVGQSEEFVALRDYRHGDPFRHIHWRTWARAGKPVVKEFEDEFFVRHALVLDTFTQPSHNEVFEEAVSVAASFASSIQTQESLLDLLFVGPQSYCFTSGRGLAHTDQMLEILASVRVCADKPFRTLEHLVFNHVKVVSGCICVLVAWDQERRDFVRKLRSLGVPVMVLLIVPAGQSRLMESGPLQAELGELHLLEAGSIEAGLAKLR